MWIGRSGSAHACAGRGIAMRGTHRMYKYIMADTPSLLDEVYRIRYQVYCVEHDYEDREKNPDGLERDEYDDHSVHGLLVHPTTNTSMGTVRLVMHKPGTMAGSLPIHKVCEHPSLRNHDFLPIKTTAEFSRFAISKTYRRRVGDGTCALQGDAEEPAFDMRREMPRITLGLITAALRLAFSSGITHVCAVMEPSLLRLLSRFGVHFELLGPQVEYHGWRQPCYAMLHTLMEGVELERYDAWEAITERGRLWPSSLSNSKACSEEAA